MNNNKTFYLYGEKSTGKKRKNVTRRVIVAGVIADNVMRFGTAECSLKDQFIKRKGRALATGRALSKNPVKRVEITEAHVPLKIFLEIASELVDSIRVSSKSKRKQVVKA